MSDDSTHGVTSLAGILTFVILFVTWYRKRDPLLDAIPTIGFSDPILSYLSVARFYLDGSRMINEGYEKVKPGLFKIPVFRRWIVLPAGAELIEDVKRAPDDVLCLRAAATELFQADYTLPMLNMKDQYHNDVIRSKLTRNIADTFNVVRDELIGSLADYIPKSGEEWTKVSILPTIQRVVCRTSSRVFVGAPLCHNHDYHELALGFTRSVMKSAIIVGLFPKPLKPIAARFLSNIPNRTRQMMAFIRPLVEERSAKLEAVGNAWTDVPNDMLTWLMSEAKGVEKSLEGLARRLLLINFAAIHTTSLTFTAVLYNILSNPEDIEPLRQEVEAVVEEEGWTKAGIDKMYKIDSFLRETLRRDGLGFIGMQRIALRPFTFSNGMTIPAGTMIAFPLGATHTDEASYSNPEEFDGFRFSKLCEKEGDVLATKYKAVSPSPESLFFGLGRHACPGRFFAANEVKVLLAHILVTYDIKFEDGKGVPGNLEIGSFRILRDTNVLFRRRQK
ncbi:cytochrome P450 [Multifurca ochricompacta]|uniref:Cytochrome P450 n=1 Tax=Multifurca ochricompacta TaxID=376703 RepID=A0AAD4QQB7_9AGAM|nr:cytochrome P450 [Multifurca ochricompacta]